MEEESEGRTNTIKTLTCFVTKMRIMVEDLTQKNMALISIGTNSLVIDRGLRIGVNKCDPYPLSIVNKEND